MTTGAMNDTAASNETAAFTHTGQFHRTEAISEIPNRWLTALADFDTSSRPEFEEVHNPADAEEVVGRYQRCTPDDVDVAVQRARAAFAAWRECGPDERAEYLRRAADLADTLVDDLSAVLTLETGKTRGESRGDAAGAGRLLREFAGLAHSAAAETDLTGAPGTSNASSVLVRRVPLGPVAVIAPWNTPIYLAFSAIAPALAAGNTVVVKPPEVAPLALTAVVTALAEVLPQGVLSVVPGDGAVAGSALTSHPDIRGVFFTGGADTGRQVMRSAAGTVKNLAMELGGNDPAIVLSSAVVDAELAREIAVGAFTLAGQVCFNVKRVYVHRSHLETFVEQLTDTAARIVVGDGFDPDVDMGPLATRDGYLRAHRLIEQARESGAVIRSVGTYAESARPDRGHYVLPTIVTDVPADDELVIAEQFCPILPIVAFDTDDEAVALANSTEFGLSASVWSRDHAHATAVARRIEAGSVFVNVHRLGASVPATPFGGVKQSGLGRNHGDYSLRSCTEEQALITFADPESDLPGMSRWVHLRDSSNEQRRPTGNGSGSGGGPDRHAATTHTDDHRG